MKDQQEEQRWAIEALVAGLDELASVLGADVEPEISAVRQDLIRALAERDGGRPEQAVSAVAAAMGRLAALGDRVSPAEGALMRALAERFSLGLQRGDHVQAEQDLARIQQRAGVPIKGGKT